MVNLPGTAIENASSTLDLLLGRADGRLNRLSDVLVSFDPIGPYTDVGGLVQQPNIAYQFNSTLMHVMAGDGSDSGAGIVASTFYYCYAVADPASPFNLALGLCTTAPTRDSRTQIWILPSAAVPQAYLFVGWVRTTAGNVFADNPAARLVVSYYNRLWKSLLARPGYVDDNLSTTFAFNNAAWAPINAGANDFVEYIANGEDAVAVEAASELGTTVAGAASIGIGDNSTTTAVAAAEVPANKTAAVSCAWTSDAPAVGYRRFSMLCHSSALITVTADQARNGSATDPAVSVLTGMMRG